MKYILREVPSGLRLAQPVLIEPALRRVIFVCEPATHGDVSYSVLAA
jgi:hypothetical protein